MRVCARVLCCSAIYRGCFDAFKAVKQLTDNYVGCRNQTWNNRARRWCLCDTDLCNRFPIDQNYHQLPIGQPRRRHRKHHHPLPPPKPASRSETGYGTPESAAAARAPTGETENRPAPAYRSVWTNYHAVPVASHRQTPADKKLTLAGDGGNQLGHVVSHSVYPDQWKANVAAALVDNRRHAKSSDSVVGERREPLTFSGDQGQTRSRSNYSSTSPGVRQYQPPTESLPERSTDRQTSRHGHHHLYSSCDWTTRHSMH